MISFIHKWDASTASYRYRAMIPARELGASMNDSSADILIYAKPLPDEVFEVKNLDGKKVIVDVCDDYSLHEWFREILSYADTITCSSEELRKRLAKFSHEATIVDDPYEFEEAQAHCKGDKLLWFGHASNLYSINNRKIAHPIRVVSNYPGTIPWNMETVLREMAEADIVILPETSRFKSANRAVEAIRRGCFVVAEAHPALSEIPGIWIGELEEGITWAMAHQDEANEMTRKAQAWVRENRSPGRIAHQWHMVIEKTVREAA